MAAVSARRTALRLCPSFTPPRIHQGCCLASLLSTTPQSNSLPFPSLTQPTAPTRRADNANGGGSANASFGISPSDLLCGVVPSSVFANYCAMLKLEGAGALALQRLAAEGLAWVPTLGNLLTLTAVALGVALNGFLNGGVGAPEGIFMLAPILLLLSQVRAAAGCGDAWGPTEKLGAA